MTDTLVLLGTAKGLFVVRASADLERIEIDGPHLPGELVYSVAIDTSRNRTRLLAGSTSEWWGSIVRHSDDLGATWAEPVVGNIKFPEDTGASVEHIWQLLPAADVVYAGVEPAALFRSDDGGESFTFLRGLWDHEDRSEWMPGFGGLGLHSIVVHRDDPQRLLVAISAGGTYWTADGGTTWNRGHDGLRNEVGPPLAVCVHRAAPDAVDPDTVFLQGHWGTYRTDNFGASWQEITSGLPSDFGFGMVTHPRRGNTAYVIPMDSGEKRWTVDARCRVYRTTDGGQSWEPLSKGLPDNGAYLSVLRDAFTGDGGDPAGLFFGSRSGEVYGSADEGERWHPIASRLPPVLSVRAVRLP